MRCEGVAVFVFVLCCLLYLVCVFILCVAFVGFRLQEVEGRRSRVLEAPMESKKEGEQEDEKTRK